MQQEQTVITEEIKTKYQARDYVRTLERFECDVEYQYEDEMDSERSRFTPTSEPELNGITWFNWNGTHSWKSVGTINGTATISQENYFIYLDEFEILDTDREPRTHSEIHSLVKRMVLHDIASNGYDGEIDVDTSSIRDVTKFNKENLL